MMRFFIDDIQCDSEVSTDVVISYNSANLSDVESSREGVHIMVRIPSTPHNDAVMGFEAYPDSGERFNSSYHWARIEVDGTELFRGTAYLDGMEVSDGTTNYKVEVVGGATQWAKQAGRKMFNLTNVDFETSLNMVEIYNSWTNDSPVKFLPVQREEYSLHNGQTTTYIPEKILTPEDYHPFLSVEAIVRSIFSDAGYKVESRFLESDELRSLYMSGAYPVTDVEAKLKRMDFKAGRLNQSAARANYAGRVYASEAVATGSVGNIVDTVASEVVDEEGNVVSTGLFSENDCFTIDDEGFAVFRPLTPANVGFEYNLKFACNYQMESRAHLQSFDHVYLEDGVVLPFKLTNYFKDCREQPYANFSYRIVIFDYSDQYRYKLRYRVNGEWKDWADVTANTVIVISPSDIVSADAIELQRAAVGSEEFATCAEDWAMYEGYVDFEGSIEAEITLRTPAVMLTPSSPKRFDSIYFGGAKPGTMFTILPGTTVRPIFSSGIGYGSKLTFADVAQIKARQSVLLSALRHMFNLRFYTDEPRKIVYIEPYNEFIRRDDIYDWSDHIDYSKPVEIREMARDVHERRRLSYRDGDDAVQRFNSENDTLLGEWSFDISSRAAIEGEELLMSQLFSPTVSLCDRFVNARSAEIMQVYNGETDGSDDGVGLLSRVVRFVGMVPLDEHERWGYPYSGAEYPLAAFHYAGGDDCEGFTLGFEDRDGCQGLHRFYDKQFSEEATLHRVSLSMHISAEEFGHLFHFIEGKPSIRSAFALKIRGMKHLYRLHAIERYDISTGVAQCVFAQIEAQCQ